MGYAIAMGIELALFVCLLWSVAFFSILLHELGHAVGYLLATGEKRWHIRVGTGRRLFGTKALTVGLFVFDGCFEPAVSGLLDTRNKKLATLAGGPAASLLLVIGTALARACCPSWENLAVITPSAVKSLLNSLLIGNAGIFLISILPARYLFGGIRGMESDGLQILHVLGSRGKE